MVKFLLRCRKITDAKAEVANVLQMIFLQQLKTYQLKRELRDFDGKRDLA